MNIKLNVLILRITAICSIVFGSIALVGFGAWGIMPSLIMGIALMLAVIQIPCIVSGIYTLLFIKRNGSCYHAAIVWGIVSIVLHISAIYVLTIEDTFHMFENHYSGFVDIKTKIIVIIVSVLCFIVPTLISIFTMVKLRKNIVIAAKRILLFIVVPLLIIVLVVTIPLCINNKQISNNTIQLTENNTYTYADFKSELVNRGLYRGSGNVQTIITAMDNDYDYEYRFVNMPNKNKYMIQQDSNRKFPIFICNEYPSLIEKSNKTASYNIIASEDWYITWKIYYVGGQIYAAIGSESEYGSSWQTSLAKTRYGIVVSEEQEIIVYNKQKNCYIKGGGIKDVASGVQRTQIPTISETYDNSCMKIRVVNRVDSQTLDAIAKELSPQYWKEYKHQY